MNNLIIFEFYTTKLHTIVAPYEPDTLHTICECLELNSHIKHWRIRDVPEQFLPFYQVKLWKKLELGFNEWDFS